MHPPFLILMRHGATAWNREERLNSRTETEILAEEESNIRSVARGLAIGNPARLLSSPSRRALQTAEILAGSLSLEVEEEELLLEVDFGSFEGSTQQALARGELAESWAAWRRGEEGVQGAESLVQAAARAARFLRLMTESPTPIVAVSHGVFIRVLLATEVLNMRAVDYRRLRLDNARLCSIAREDGLTRLIALNAPA